jgi:hypothetical protein
LEIFVCFYAPKALAIRVAASRRPAASGIQSLSVAKVFSSIFCLGDL